jgi:hypothetical protein
MKDGHGVVSGVHRMWLDDEGIVHAESIAGAQHTRADAEEGLRLVRELAGRRARPLLVDLRFTKSIDRDARVYYAGGATVGIALAVALVTDSPLTRVIASFFMGVNKPPVPTRMFTSEADALTWLRTFLA